MAVNLAIEFHDSEVERIRTAGPDAVLEMSVYVHASRGCPGVDAGSGWYQGAEMVVADAVRQQTVRTGYIGNGQTGDMGNTDGPCRGHRPTP
jgi:hypothetical protein